MGLPWSVTSWPLCIPSVASMAIVRTVFSPRCCATSSTTSWSPIFATNAFIIGGSSPSNATSTTAPNTCVILPVLLLAIICSFPKQPLRLK